ncbi:triose-phosphate isomerase [Anaerotignum faecicola]|nr:triose-phosphate isomerase [Anaerotignum faecicola]
MRKKIIAGNWKMNKTPKEAAELIETLKGGINTNMVDVVLCVPYIDIIPAAEALKGTNISLGAQNVYFEESGAYTGEVSPSMLKECGVEYVIAGHSERREYFGETDEIVNKKLKKIIEHGMTPILCCGETLSQRELGVTIEWIRMQIKGALNGIAADDVKNIVIAYEPIWAIGTGKTATSDQAQEVCGQIRQAVRELYGREASQSVRIQYGGSVNASNAAEIFAKEDIDGGLVGGASLKEEFVKIVNY